jgi:hypothetical protein
MDWFGKTKSTWTQSKQSSAGCIVWSTSKFKAFLVAIRNGKQNKQTVFVVAVYLFSG